VPRIAPGDLKSDMRKIVIIEDNPVVARLYENKLKADGNAVSVAMDGAAGLELIYSVKPDMLLLDLMLPNMSGIEIIKTIRKDYRFTHLPIMAYSSADEDVLSEAVQAGTTKIVSKNEASFKEILAHVQELMKVTGNWQRYSSDEVNQGEAAVSDGTAPQAGKPRILIVEDDAITAKLISSIAEANGFVSTVIADGQEAYKVLAEEANFAAAVLDVELPKIKGTDLLKYMRSEKRLLSVPVIVMTASENRVRIQLDSHAAGASFFIAKPFDRSTFEGLLKTLILTRQ
jgi:CheY-like chemotaxis protein